MLCPPCIVVGVSLLPSQSVFDEEPNQKIGLSARHWRETDQGSRLLPHTGLGQVGAETDCSPI